VAVRDGKLASESVRLKSDPNYPHEEHAQVFEEMAILDSAGRLSIPREHLNHFNINRRVRLEIVDGGILIRPPSADHADPAITPSSAVRNDSAEEPGERRRLPAWLIRSRKVFLKILGNLRKGTKDAK
jgi:peptide/nickel transport system ATP-binding protein